MWKALKGLLMAAMFAGAFRAQDGVSATDEAAVLQQLAEQARYREAFLRAQSLQAREPSNRVAAYYLATLGVRLTTPNEDQIRLAEAAAEAIIAHRNDDAYWIGARSKEMTLAEAYRSLAWVAMWRKDYPRAERALTDLLTREPNDAAASYDLGRAILAQKNRSRDTEALFHITRAAFHEGPGAMRPEAQQRAREFVVPVLRAFTGDEATVRWFVEATQKIGFLAKAELDKFLHKRCEDCPPIMEIVPNDPQFYRWLMVKRELVSERGVDYFESSVKGAGLPKLKGVVVSQARRAVRVFEIRVAIMDDATPEIALRIKGRLAKSFRTGQTIEFDFATPIEFTQEPFLLECEMEAANVWAAATPVDRSTKPRRRSSYH